LTNFAVTTTFDKRNMRLERGGVKEGAGPAFAVDGTGAGLVDCKGLKQNVERTFPLQIY
jgi:hypothetical protein